MRLAFERTDFVDKGDLALNVSGQSVRFPNRGLPSP